MYAGTLAHCILGQCPEVLGRFQGRVQRRNQNHWEVKFLIYTIMYNGNISPFQAVIRGRGAMAT